MALTVRAVRWATDALSCDDTTVSALARHLGVDWHTGLGCDRGRSEGPHQQTRADLPGVKTLGVDEHIWRPSRIGVDRAVTIMVDLTRDQAGCLHARLLDAVVGRSGTVYKAWLKAQPDGFLDGVEQAALDPFRGYANAIQRRASRTRSRSSMPSTWSGSAPRSSTKSAAVSSKTRWAAAATSTTRSTRSAGCSATASNTSPRSSRSKLTRCLDAGDPGDEVHVAWQCYQQLRSIYHATPAIGREIAQKVLDSFHTCPIPEVARLGRTLRAWRAQVLAYFDTGGVSNGGPLFSFVSFLRACRHRGPLRHSGCSAWEERPEMRLPELGRAGGSSAPRPLARGCR